jgi:hypothetical protein
VLQEFQNHKLTVVIASVLQKLVQARLKLLEGIFNEVNALKNQSECKKLDFTTEALKVGKDFGEELVDEHG